MCCVAAVVGRGAHSLEATLRYGWRIAGSVLAMAGVATLVAACGGGDDGATNAGEGQGGFAAYQACLSQHGVTLPSRATGRPRPSGAGVPGSAPEGGGTRPSDRPGGGFGGGFGMPEGVDQETWRNAQEACASVRPTGQRGGFDSSALVAYRNCLSEHGVTSSAGPVQLNTADAKVAAAARACAPLRPSFPAGGNRPRGATPTPSAD